MIGALPTWPRFRAAMRAWIEVVWLWSAIGCGCSIGWSLYEKNEGWSSQVRESEKEEWMERNGENG